MTRYSYDPDELRDEDLQVYQLEDFAIVGTNSKIGEQELLITTRMASHIRLIQSAILERVEPPCSRGVYAAAIEGTFHRVYLELASPFTSISPWRIVGWRLETIHYVAHCPDWASWVVQNLIDEGVILEKHRHLRTGVISQWAMHDHRALETWVAARLLKLEDQ
jgi:hypothetical protein